MVARLTLRSAIDAVREGGDRVSDAAEFLGALLENSDFLGGQGNADLLDRWGTPRSRRLLNAKQYKAALDALLVHIRRAESPDLNVVRSLGRVRHGRAIRPLVSIVSSALARNDATVWEQAFNSLENQVWARRRSELEGKLISIARSSRRSRDSTIRERANGYLRARAAPSRTGVKMGRRAIPPKKR